MAGQERHRFYLPSASCREGDEEVLDPRESHHACQVLRLKVGDPVVVVDGCGRELQCTIRDPDRRHARLRVVESSYIAPLPYSITLIQAVPKGKTMDLIVQKATELGVRRIVPLLSDRSLLKGDSRDMDRKVEKWHTIAIDALKQCRAAWLPRIERPVGLSEHLTSSSDTEFDLSLLATMAPDAKHLRHYFEKHCATSGARPSQIELWIGPEGDFTPDERARLQNERALPLSLGPHILRTETAALYGLSCLRHELESPAPP